MFFMAKDPYKLGIGNMYITYSFIARYFFGFICADN